MSDNETIEWAAALPKISLQINRSVYDSSNKTPYEIVFGRKPRTLAVSERNTLEIEDEAAPPVDEGEEDIGEVFEFVFLAYSEEASSCHRVWFGSHCVGLASQQSLCRVGYEAYLAGHPPADG